MDISWLGNGDTEVNITCPPKTYHSTEEKLKDKQGIAQEALSALSKKGITNAGPGKHAKRNSVPQLGYFKATQLPEGQIRWDFIPPPFGNINYSPSSNNYTVEKGDNLTKIAHDNHISLQELERINPQISNPNFIYSGDVVNLPTKSTTNGYTWNPSLIQEPSTPPPVTTYGVTPTPMTANENNTENFPNNASSQLRYQPYIVQPDATSHASLAPQNVPSEASNSDIPNIKDLSEGLKNFPTLGEAISTIVGDESLANKFKIGGDVIAGATDAYSLFTAKSIDEKIEAFGKTAKHVAEWWASREIPVVGEGLLARDIGIMLYNGVRYVDTK